MPTSNGLRTLGVKDRIADARRNFTASREAALLTLVGVSEETIHLAQMACEGDGSLALLDATPEIRQASQRALDQSRASILDRKLSAAIDVGLDAETSWAVHRTVGLAFSSPESMFAFLYQATVEERPEMLPLSVTTVARWMRIANTAFFAAVARQIEERGGEPA